MAGGIKRGNRFSMYISRGQSVPAWNGPNQKENLGALTLQQQWKNFDMAMSKLNKQAQK